MDYDLIIDVVSLSVNLVGLLVLLIVLYGNFFELNNHESRSNRLFSVYSLALLVGVFSDAISYIGEIVKWPDNVQYWIAVVTFAIGGVISYLFILYVYEIINERKHVAKAYQIIALLICVTTVIVDTILSIRGDYFTVIDGVYEEGALVTISSEMSIMMNIMMFIIVCRYFKALGLHDAIAISTYIVIPLIGAVIYRFFGPSVEYAMMVLSILIIFVMVQFDYQNKVAIREHDLFNQSRTDNMTGLLNRAAHDFAISDYKVIPRNFVYMSFDLNGLKAANDNLGHAAGDELIVGVAKCIASCFNEYGKTFRIGGDEFAAVLEIDDETLKAATEKFDETIKNWSGEHVEHMSISYGYATMQEFCHVKKMGIDGLAKMANGRMYKSKAEYYAQLNK